MKKFLLLCFATLLSSQALAAAKVEEVSSSGVKAWFIEDRTLPIICLKIAFRNAGAAYDPANKQGLAYFTAGMMNEGAGSYDSESFRKALEDNSIEFAADADKDYFYVSVKTLTGNRELAVKLLNLALTDLRLAGKDAEKVRGQIQAIIKSNGQNPSYVAGEKLNALVFGKHPYSRTVYGASGSIAAIRPGDMKKFAASRFAKDALVVSMAGDLGKAEAEETLSAIASGLPEKQEGVPEVPEFESFPPGKTGKISMNVPQSVYMFALKGVKRDAPEFYPAFVMNHILGGGGLESRLMDEVREKRGLAYGVSTDVRTYRKAGVFMGAVSTRAEKIGESMKVIEAELARMKKDGVSEEELKKTRNYLIGSFPLQLDNNQSLASFLLGMQLQNLDRDFLEKRNGYIEAVTLEQVNKAAADIIAPEALLGVVVGK